MNRVLRPLAWTVLGALAALGALYLVLPVLVFRTWK